MKYAVRKHYKDITLSEYCREHNLTLVIDETTEGFMASAFAPNGKLHACGVVHPSIHSAFSSLCREISHDLDVRVIVGNDLEAE